MKRCLNLLNLLNKSSHFLFGPRGVGKSYLLRGTLEKFNYINLLHSKTYLALKARPDHLESLIDQPLVAIDEIQRIPELLNEVHRLLEEKNVRFLLTGSSARKLRRGETNLLAGRAYRAELHALTWNELAAAGSFDLERYLTIGGLPKSILEGEGFDYLYAYVDTYLKEEIQAEALVRNLADYSRFLVQAAIDSGKIINYAKIANEAQLAPTTVRSYYQILEDTLLGYTLPPWTKSKKRKAIQTAKFYLFDCGVTNALVGLETIPDKTDAFGRAFEQFIGNEIRAYLSYMRLRKSLCYWRSKSQFEVDFVIGDEVAVEVKAATQVSDRDHKGLKAIGEEISWKRRILVSRDTQQRRFSDSIEHLYWEDFLRQLWAGEIVGT